MAWCPRCRRSFSSQRTLQKHKNLCDLEAKEYEMKESIKRMEQRDIEVKNLTDQVLCSEIERLESELFIARNVCKQAAEYLDFNSLTNIGHGSILHKMFQEEAAKI